jgi:hypothetical protein
VACGPSDSSGPADAAPDSAASDAAAADVAYDASTDAAAAGDGDGAMESGADGATVAHDAGGTMHDAGGTMHDAGGTMHDAGGAIEAGADAAVARDSGSMIEAGADGAALRTYTTLFPLTENPISEGGNWISGQSVGLDWHDVSTTPGLAIGHQSVTSYTDGTALLTGAWGPTQSVEAVVHTVNQKDSCYQEVELRLRSSLSAHSCSGYEVSFKASKTSAAYLIIVRWNGPVGNFTYLSRYDGAKYGVADGDTVKATIEGNVITAYLNGMMVGTATDSTYSSGSPGMGFNLETSGDSSCIGTNGDYGFTRLTATGQ